MSKENKFEVSKFEQLETSNGEILQGGFSTSEMGAGFWDWVKGLVTVDANGYCPVTNNCNGGNCASGCGVAS